MPAVKYRPIGRSAKLTTDVSNWAMSTAIHSVASVNHRRSTAAPVHFSNSVGARHGRTSWFSIFRISSVSVIRMQWIVGGSMWSMFRFGSKHCYVIRMHYSVQL